MIGSIRDVNFVLHDINSVRIGYGSYTPTIEIISVPIKNHDRRVLPLKSIYPVLRIGRNRTDYP
jgi:hypothetical protein